MIRTLSLWKWPSVSIRGAVRMWRRDIVLYRRSYKMNILPNFFQPILYLVAIGVGLGVYLRDAIGGVPYIQFIAPGLAATAAMNGSVFEITFNLFIKMNVSRIYDSVITTPLEPEDAGLGELMWTTTRSALYSVGFLAVLGALGHVDVWGALLAFPALVLVGMAFALVGCIYTCSVPSIDYFTYFFVLIVTPLFLFSGIFFPVEDLPRVAQIVAWLTPLHHGVELTRAITLGNTNVGVWGHALWLAGFCLLTFPPAINLFRRRLVV